MASKVTAGGRSFQQQCDKSDGTMVRLIHSELGVWRSKH